jgi:hypothetical protein
LRELASRNVVLVSIAYFGLISIGRTYRAAGRPVNDCFKPLGITGRVRRERPLSTVWLPLPTGENRVDAVP